MPRMVRTLGHLVPLALGCVAGLAFTTFLTPSLHAASFSPTLSITAPSTGSTVSGTVSLWAAASDVGFAGLQFQVNGVNQGSEITSGSCTVNWDTTGAPEGNYTISAIGRDDSGNPTSATPVTVAVINSAPQISGITAWNITDTGASITWNTNQSADGEADYGTTTSYGSNSSAPTMATTHTVVLTGLTSGTTYHFQIQAWNALSMNRTSADATFSTTGGAAPPAPSAPVISAVSTSNVVTSSAFVNWTTDQATTGAVDFGTTTGYGATATDATSTTSHSLLISNLTAGTSYHYRVRATNAQSLSTTTADFTFSTSAPPPPNPDQSAPQISGVTAWNITTSSASITWGTN